MSDEQPPWESIEYKLDVLARELGVNFRERYIKNRFQRADSVEFRRSDQLVVTYNNALPSAFTQGGPEWGRMAGVRQTEDGIEVTIEVRG